MKTPNTFSKKEKLKRTEVKQVNNIPECEQNHIYLKLSDNAFKDMILFLIFPKTPGEKNHQLTG